MRPLSTDNCGNARDGSMPISSTVMILGDVSESGIGRKASEDEGQRQRFDVSRSVSLKFCSMGEQSQLSSKLVAANLNPWAHVEAEQTHEDVRGRKKVLRENPCEILIWTLKAIVMKGIPKLAPQVCRVQHRQDGCSL